MKKVFFILVVSLLSFSCTVVKYSVSGSVVDYSTYTDKGFFITESNSVNFDYKAIGSIYVECNSGEVSLSDEQIEKNKARIESMNGPGRPQPTTTEWKRCDIKDALNKLYELAIEKRANGVINMKINPITAFNTVTKSYDLVGISITGMLIKK